MKRVDSATKKDNDCEQQFRTIIETASDSIFIKDRNLVYTYANPAMEKLFDMPLRNIYGKTDAELLGEVAAEHIRQIDMRVLNGETIEEEYSKPVQNETIVYHVIKAPMQDEAGNITGLFGIARNITERKQVELALKENEEKLRSTISSMDDLLFTLDKDNVFSEYYQPISQTDLYTSPEIFLGKSIIEIMPADISGLFLESIQKIQKNHQVEQFDYALTMPGKSNGSKKQVRWYNARISERLNSRGEYDGVTVTARDITKRKQVEDDLNMLALAVNQSAEGIAVADHEGIIQFTNPAWAEMHGYRVEELTGQHFSIFHSEEQMEKEVHPFNRIVIAKETSQGEIGHIRKNGTEFLTRMTVTLLKDTNGKPMGMLAIARDITELKKLESQLNQAAKMDALGTLAGGIAHDFNNILATILGYAELIRNDLPEDSVEFENIEAISKAGIRAKELVKQILTFSRQTKQEQIPVRIDQIIEEAIKFLQASLPVTIKIETQLHNNSDYIMADPTQIHQIIINLCSNSYQAMGEKGGLLRISLNRIEFNSTQLINGTELPPGKYLKMDILDTGPGIDAETRQRIFDPFFTTKAVNEGTGLGLSVVHGIVSAHKGAITLTSKPGVGTTFSIYFPKTQIKSWDEQKEPHSVTGGKEHILLIDDEEPLLKMSERLLTFMGYAVTTCNTGQKALQLLKQFPNQFDLVITDQIMPEMTGIELAGHLKNITPDIPIILMSGFSENVSSENIRNYGINEFLDKPFDRIELDKTIRKILTL